MKPTIEQLEALQKALGDAEVPLTNRCMHYIDDKGRYVIGTIDRHGAVSREYFEIVKNGEEEK